MVLGAVPAYAGLTGKAFSAEYDYPALGMAYPPASFTPPVFVVGPGEETAGEVEGVTTLHVDFADSTLTIVLNTILVSPTWNTVPFNGPVFTSATALGIAGAAVDSATTMAGFDGSRILLTGNQIGVDWNGLSYTDGTVVKIDFAVPEPGTMSLAAVGLLGLGLLRRRAPGAA